MLKVSDDAVREMLNKKPERAIKLFKYLQMSNSFKCVTVLHMIHLVTRKKQHSVVKYLRYLLVFPVCPMFRFVSGQHSCIIH